MLDKGWNERYWSALPSYLAQRPSSAGGEASRLAK
jgi:hypothetical protein